MCQLTLVNLHEKELNQYYTVFQSFINSMAANQDGFGYVSDGKIYKTKVCPALMINLGEIISQITEKPTLSHVRHATVSNGSKVISNENAHPFESKDLILMHNGSLETEIENKKYEDLIDSAIFLAELQLVYNEEPDFVKALQKTYNEKFTGKFAFLIYNKREKRIYAIRGETADLCRADLWTVSGKYLGFVINTDKISLAKGYLLFNNYLQISRGEILDFTKKDVKELDKNTIYIINDNDELEKVGEIVERKKEIVAGNAWHKNNHANNTYRQNTLTEKEKRVEGVSNVLLEFMKKYHIGIGYLDVIFFVTLGKPLLGASQFLCEQFIEEIIPKIDSNLEHENIIDEWKKISELKPSLNFITFHKNNKIQFPYMLESIANLRKIRKGFENAQKNIVH